MISEVIPLSVLDVCETGEISLGVVAILPFFMPALFIGLIHLMRRRGITQKNKAGQVANGIGVQFPGSSTIANGFVCSISDSLSNVNRKRKL